MLMQDNLPEAKNLKSVNHFCMAEYDKGIAD